MTDQPSPAVARVTVELIAKGLADLEALTSRTGLCQADVVNRTLQLAKLVDDERRGGGKLKVERVDGSVYELADLGARGPVRPDPLKPHEMTEACDDTHCHIHGVHEPADGAFLVCFECNHVYPTARALRRDYRRGYWESTAGSEWGPADPLWHRVWRVLTVRASRIDFCQHCTHDF